MVKSFRKALVAFAALIAVVAVPLGAANQSDASVGVHIGRSAHLSGGFGDSPT